MRIEELVLDGFKSYPVRTSISGWDPSFNAITGLNGSGKSNILDAICFVLGLTNLTTVRAANLQDLIYKRGQAGCTKATVSVVFDNSDKSTAPIGFEKDTKITVTRQIAVGGLSKYLINGRKSDLKSVHNLFQSVQLNINNPNFLIMQGKITKVLNMPPLEILGMVEEAAGTRMYEERKDKALKTMAKKDKRMFEIESLLQEEIKPKLDKLRQDKSAFLEYQKSCVELERLDRLVVAHEYLAQEKKAQSADQKLDACTSSVEALTSSVSNWKEDLQQLMRKKTDIEARRSREAAKGGKLAGLEARSQDAHKEAVRLTAKRDLDREGILEEQRRIADMKAELAELESSLTFKRKDNEGVSQTFQIFQQKYQAASDDLSRSEELLQTLLTGLTSSSQSDSAGGFQGALADAKKMSSQAGTEIAQAKLRTEHTQQRLKKDEAKAKGWVADDERLRKELAVAEKELAGLQQKLQSLICNSEEEESLTQEEKACRESFGKLNEHRSRIREALHSLDFRFNSPDSNFDKTLVKGLIANLINLTPESYKYATALEICAGGRLYNVVVDNEHTAAKLLKPGVLRGKVTILPLNKIQVSRVQPEKIAKAQSIAPGKVNQAIKLIKYDQKVAFAMEFVFSSTLICNDSESAKAVTFDKGVLLKSVTIQGDVYDPSGTLSGGSIAPGESILIKARQLQEVELDLEIAKQKLDAACQGLEDFNLGQIRFREASNELELKQHHCSGLRDRIQNSNANRSLKEMDALRSQLKELQQEIQTATSRQKLADEDVIRINQDMAEFKENRGDKLEQLKAQIKSKRAEISKSTSEMKAKQKEAHTMQLELEQLVEDVEKFQIKVHESEQAFLDMQKDVKESDKAIHASKNALEAIEKELKQEKALLVQFEDELQELSQDVSGVKKDISEAEVRLKELENEIQTIQRDSKSGAKRLLELKNQYTWIPSHRSEFGKSNTAFDFTGIDIGQYRVRRDELAVQEKSMKKKVNTKVMNMIDSVEKKEIALKTMHSMVLKDKVKIEATMKELDLYKTEALEKTWSKVSDDFGGIFSELLPGNHAKLQPPDGQDISQGLEVKVRLGLVWKQSLTELSGGQRSLIALSLIMSLLQFKPAPMYILDEIDAALDLSHTQHIGSLFRNRFKNSQFIVVSLKEGLFSHANVLFRTKFRDGTSIVERTGSSKEQGASADRLQRRALL